MRVHAPDPRFGGGVFPLCGHFGETTVGGLDDVDCLHCLRKLGLTVSADRALIDAALAWHDAWVRDGTAGGHNLRLAAAVDHYQARQPARRTQN